jgi:ParB family chromosome partitioning protein
MALDLSALDEAPLAVGDSKPKTTPPRAPLDRFVEDPDQPRTEFEGSEWDGFVADIKERGILQPIVVIELDDGRLKIRFGARRYRAAKACGLPDAPYVTTEDERQLDDFAQVAENEQRAPLQPLELATFIAKKRKEGMTNREIAAKLRVDPSVVTHLLSLVDAPTFLLELYHTRKCRAAHYLYELRKLHKLNAELVERRCAAADEIDKAFLVALGREVDPPPAPPAPPAGPSTVQGALGKVPQEGNGSGGSGEDPDGDEGGRDDAATAPAVQQIPPHDPGIEKDSGATRPGDPDKLKKPLLLAKHKGREVMVMLNKRPSTPGMVFIKYEDGSGESEVVIGDVKLTMLTESRV